jgi:hypothetical protein
VPGCRMEAAVLILTGSPVSHQMKRTTFVALLLFIVSVSAYDSLRCVADAGELYAVELNPMARLLIDGDDVSRLVCGKAFGVGVVVGVLCELRASGYRRAGIIASAVAVAQLLVAIAYFI